MEGWVDLGVQLRVAATEIWTRDLTIESRALYHVANSK